MADENKIPVVIRTKVYLSDPDYFCNKSWTMSYNLNTGSWISFHTYIPNFYIGENNFFYSGLNGCCDDSSAGGGFQALVGIMTKPLPPSTTTTTTGAPQPTTTHTTTLLYCDLDGFGVTTDCELDGTGVITVYPTTTSTTTVCLTPTDLNVFTFVQGYTIGIDPPVDSSLTLQDACDAVPVVQTSLSPDNVDIVLTSFFGATYTTEDVTALPILGEYVYNAAFIYCTYLPDGWYSVSTLPNMYSIQDYIYHIVDGIIVEISNCGCETTTTTTTLPPVISECCGILFTSGDVVYYYVNSITDSIQPIDVPGYVTSLGIAMTNNKLWSIDTDIQEWDITLSPFNATFNRAISFSGGFTTSSGIVALDDTTLIAVNDAPSPQEVTELDIATLTASNTIKFTLQTNRVAQGNMLYVQTGELLIINKDSVTLDYYISEYDYATGTLLVDINVGAFSPTSIYECQCNIYVTDVDGNIYVIIKSNPQSIIDTYRNITDTSSITVTALNSATQVGSCVISSIADITTTTTTTAP
jgi:hypothetical protein